MQEESQQILDLNEHFFTIPEADRYVDFFFTDHRQDRLVQSNFNQDNLSQQKLFPEPNTKSSVIIPNVYDSNEQQKKLQTKKKMKNTYASKIAKLVHQQPKVDLQQNEVEVKMQHNSQRNSNCNQNSQMYSSSFDSNIDKKKLKLQKNRQSAQKSRKMKKQYIQILVQKVDELQEQLDTERKINEKNAQKLKKYSYHEAILNGYFVSRDQIMEKLQNAIKNKASQQQLTTLLDSVKFCFGGAGKERMNIVRYYYEQIFDLIVPDLSKYVVYSAVKSIGIFHDNKQKSRELMKVMDVKGQKQSYILSLKQSLIQSRESINKIAEELITAKQKLDKQVSKIDDIFQQMRCVMNVQAQIRCILFLQKNKYKPQYSSAWKDWKNIFLQKLAPKQGSQIKKLIKTS